MQGVLLCKDGHLSEIPLQLCHVLHLPMVSEKQTNVMQQTSIRLCQATTGSFNFSFNVIHTSIHWLTSWHSRTQTRVTVDRPWTDQFRVVFAKAASSMGLNTQFPSAQQTLYVTPSPAPPPSYYIGFNPHSYTIFTRSKFHHSSQAKRPLIFPRPSYWSFTHIICAGVD